MKEKIETLKGEILDKLAKTTNLKEVNDLKVEYLGKKGPIQELTGHMKDLDVEEKKSFGMLLNGLKQDVTNAIDTIFKDSTVITIAHRISTVKSCDKVIVMDDGQIVEVGKPDELIKNQKGKFYSLYYQYMEKIN